MAGVTRGAAPLIERGRQTIRTTWRQLEPRVRDARDRVAPVIARAKPLVDRITDAGRAVLVLGIVAWFGGMMLGWNEMMILATACVLVVAGGLLFTLGQASLDVTLTVEPRRVTVGEPAVGRVSVRNTGGRQVVAVRLEVPVGVAGLARLDPPSLARDEEFSDVFVIPTQRRSIVRLGPVRSVRGDPLGLARRQVNWCDPVDLFVHPYIERLPGAAAGWMRDLEGTPTNDLSPSDVAFHTLREYVPGDDRRNIHWRTSARTGKLMVRQFVDTRRAHLGAVLSLRADDYATEEEFELAVSVVGSLGASALANEQEVTCVAGRKPLATFVRERLLDSLSGVEMDAKSDDVISAVRRARRHLNSASIGILITGSRVTLAQLQSATAWFPPQLRVVAVRVDPTSASEARMVGTTQLLTVSAISDLAPRLAALARR